MLERVMAFRRQWLRPEQQGSDIFLSLSNTQTALVKRQSQVVRNRVAENVM